MQARPNSEALFVPSEITSSPPSPVIPWTFLSTCPPVLPHRQARPNSVALFVPSEITSFAFYSGNEKDRMVANVLFRWAAGYKGGD